MVMAFAVRLSIFTQSRDLFIDEANVARNIYEKSYVELAGVLDYEQFAPPLFSMFTKLNATLFGFNEMALRLLPFISSLLAILLFVYLIHLLIGFKHAIYPLALFAGGYLFLHYATELKQYSSDFLVTLILLVTAIKTAKQLGTWQHTLLWMLIGSLALWLSMPSVFILFSIGMFWFLKILEEQNYSKLYHLFIASGIWLLQFALYYYLILQHQVSSDYLQNYHAEAFLYFPKNWGSIMHDLRLVSGIISQAGGHTSLALIFNCLLLTVGTIALIKKDKKRAVIFILPLVLLCFAALVHKYALVARLTLFIQPIVLLLIAYGVYTLFTVKSWWFRAVIIIIMLVNVYNHQNFKYLYDRFEIQEIHYALDKIEDAQLQKNKDPIWVHNGAVPAFIYYTEMSGQQKNYSSLVNQAKLLNWDTDYALLLGELEAGDRVWVLLTNFFPADKDKVFQEMQSATLVSTVDKPGCLLLQFEK